MWGICSDIESFQDGLFQSVVHYKADVTNNKVILLLPIEGYMVDIEKIKVNGKVKSFRYFEKDLLPYVPC